ncbi:hypothetical protein AJ79_01475 [Helicocarpus griseus UAMH5409]|uniref:Pentacotripeptide-repeat region of PRORP domain-containing protein n=1 Tax=Helicocarpus griseus UAMH5409 TaxID=1447875 RepID=A0A2B7Y701_9EURO|nr:hypothetical protein AJ79_01475 [Helicocarpus griseus UAMH5409]
MLERAAQRLENAGECLFRHSKRHTRSRRILHPEFWHHGAADIDAPLRSFDFPQSPRSSAGRPSPATEPLTLPTSHLQHPRLEFLYPPETQAFARYRLPRVLKTSVNRRRKLGSRGYSTAPGEVAEPEQSTVPPIEEDHIPDAEEENNHGEPHEAYDFHYHDLYKQPKKAIIHPSKRTSPLLPFMRFGLSYSNFYRRQRETMIHARMEELGLERSRKTSGFRAFLSKGKETKRRHRVGRDGEVPVSPAILRRLDRHLSGDSPPNYNGVWKLYKLVKTQKPEYHPRVLAYLSESEDPLDFIRSRVAFEAIGVEHRTASDYGYVAKSLIRNENNLNLLADICKEAVSNFKGQKCWDHIMVVLVDGMKWKEAVQFMNLKPYLPKDRPRERIIYSELANMRSLPERLLSLLETLRDKKFSQSDAEPLISFLAYLIVREKNVLRQAPVEQILLLFYSLQAIGLLESRHLFLALSTLGELDLEVGSFHSLQVYWQARIFVKDAKPYEKAIIGLLQVAMAREKVEITNDLMREFRALFKKPSEEAYQIALTGFSKLGDVRRVTNIFQDYVRHYGKPTDLEFVNPLIQVNAVVGKVYQARQQFERLSSEFLLGPNVTSWNLLLLAYARSRDKAGGLATLQEMLNAGLKPDSDTLAIMMDMFAKDGSVDSVMDFLQVAKAYGIKLTMAMLHPVVEVLCNNMKYEAAEKFADTVMKLNAPGSVTCMWNTILSHYASIPDLDSMLAVHDRMRGLGVKFDDMTYAATLTALVRTGNHDDAVRVVRKLEARRQVAVTEYQYAIILYGYAMIGDLEMVEYTRAEIIKKFGRLSLSAKLSILKAKIEMDKRQIEEGNYVGHNNEIRLVNAEEYLDSIVKDFSIKEWATFVPQPGAERMSIRDAFPSLYYTELISAYKEYDAAARSRTLASHLESKQKRLEDNPDLVPLSQLARRMEHLLRDRHWAHIDAVWAKAFEQAKLGATITAKFAIDEKKDSDMYVSAVSNSNTYRFSLAEPLSILMESYAEQDLHSKIAVIISQLQKAGFALTTHNWSYYIELLATSPRKEERLNAFILFEKLFIPNFTGWAQVRAGSSVRPMHVPSTFALQENRNEYRPRRPDHMGHEESSAWAKLEPDHMQPSYDTIVRLASALVDARARSVLDAGEEVNSILTSAPLTLIAMGTIRDPQGGFGQILNEAQDIVKSAPVITVMEPGVNDQDENQPQTSLQKVAENVDGPIPSPYDLIPLPEGAPRETKPNMPLIQTLLEEDARFRQDDYNRRVQRREFLEGNPNLEQTPPRLPFHLHGKGKETQHWQNLREVALKDTPRLLQHGHLELPDRSKEAEEAEQKLNKQRIMWRKEEGIWRRAVESGRWKNWIPPRNQRLWLKKIDAQNLPLILQYLRLEEEAYDIKDRYRKEWIFWCRLQIWKHMKDEEKLDWKLYHEKNRAKRWRGLREWQYDLDWIRKKIPLPEPGEDGEFASEEDREAHGLHYHAKTRLNEVRDMMAKVYKLAYSEFE